MSVSILRGNALALPLADDTVDLVVTSPPYFGLRSYQDNGSHYSGQIGSEATPAEFLDALIAATAEMMRVLKPSGSIFVNLGDKYASSSAGSNWHTASLDGGRGRLPELHESQRAAPRLQPGVPTKSLILIPERYRIRCVDELGLIARAVIVWSKPNGLPESVTDRVRRSHEDWVHLTKRPRYYSAIDEIREEHSPLTYKQAASDARSQVNRSIKLDASRDSGKLRQSFTPPPNPLGKLPGSVWTINEGDSLVRSVLNAVASQGITADEGERILLWTRRDSGATSTAPMGAGNGSDSSPLTDTRAITRSTREQAQHTASPTGSQSDPSPTGSPSTTSAETAAASTLGTSSPSRSKRTSPDDPSLTSAHRATPTTSRTPTSAPTASESAGPACETGCEPPELVNAPPSVWQIATQPLTVPPELGVDHFAAFPMEWPRRIVTGWSPREVCTACGEGRRPVARSEYVPLQSTNGDADKWRKNHARDRQVKERGDFGRARSESVITGYACACPDPTAPTTPGTVLDPFGGTGTTALVAHALGRHGISVDMSADYCRLAEWRTSDPKELARAQQREYTPPREQVNGQDAFDFDLDMPQKPPPDKFHRTGWQNGKVDRTPYRCVGCGKEKHYADVSRPCPHCGEVVA